MMTLFVVYTPDTGNVVGALNAVGAVPPADDTDVAALVGKELRLRVSLGPDELATLAVPARSLAFHTPDDEPRVLTDPFGFGVEQVPNAKPKPALVPLPVSAETLEFTGVGLTVRVPQANTIQNTPVLAYVSAGQDTIPVLGTIRTGDQEVVLPVAVDPGPHGVLVLVAGWAGRLEKVVK